jgi:N-acyl-L-homoserine lactone synthetase
LITVSPLGIERLLHRMGVNAHRAGPPMLVDGKPIFACWIEVDQQTLTALDVALVEDASTFSVKSHIRSRKRFRKVAKPEACLF